MSLGKIFLILSFILCWNAYSYDELCPSVKVKHLKKLKFSDNEKRFLCGDKEEPAYKNIPSYQAKFFVTGFLQDRGYLKPKIKLENGVLLVHHGPLAKIKKINLDAKDPKLKNEVKTRLRRLFNRRVLTTNTLNSIEADAKAEVRNRGYPCPKIKSAADIDRNMVFVSVEELYFHKFGKLKKETIEGLRENALDRFYAFEENEPFNADLLKLTERRMTRAEVVQGTYFLEKCEGENFELSQNFILGPPRSLHYGAGASTELGPMARVRWSHNRYKSMASQMTATAQASFRSQSLNVTLDSFIWKNFPRRSLLSQAEIIRESQVEYEQLLYRVNPAMKWTRDSEGFHKLYTLGPSYEGGTYHSNNDTDTNSFSSGIIGGSLQWMSHDYELFDVIPQEGQLFTYNFDFRHPYIGFDSPLLKMETDAVHVERLSTWGRGALIGAVHLNLGTTWVNTNEMSLNSLPPSVKFFGGGSDDIRGFYLKTLPKNDGAGALTKTVLKTELRKTHLFIPSLEAFAFVDGGYFSEASWTIDPTLYYSPGFGLRWLTPFGMVQSFAARALSANPYKDSGNLYYVGIGGTF